MSAIKSSSLFCCLIFLISCVSCKKEDKPTALEIGSTIPNSTIEMLCLDEENGLPIPGMKLTLEEQWSTGINVLLRYSVFSNSSGLVTLNAPLDRNHLVTYEGAQSDSSYFLRDAVLLLKDDQFRGSGAYKSGGSLRFNPVFSSDKRAVFNLLIPRWSEISIDYIQDSVYTPTMNASEFFLTMQVLQKDSTSTGVSLSTVGSFMFKLLNPGDRIKGNVKIPVYANRKYEVYWQVYESEITSYYYDDPEILEKRQGFLQLDRAESRKSNPLNLHF